MLANEKFKPGEKIKIIVRDAEEKISYTATYTVIRQYAHYVLTKSKGGNRVCFTHAELLTRGLCTQKLFWGGVYRDRILEQLDALELEAKTKINHGGSRDACIEEFYNRAEVVAESREYFKPFVEVEIKKRLKNIRDYRSVLDNYKSYVEQLKKGSRA